MRVVDPERRKKQSMSALRAIGVDVSDALPVIESAAEVTLRKPGTVARRMVCLVLVSDIARDQDAEDCIDYLRDNDLVRYLSPSERELVEGSTPNDATMNNLAWRIEAAFFLLWAMGRVELPDTPDEESEPDLVYGELPSFNAGAESFFKGATLLDKETILDQADLLYRMHWAVRHTSTKVLNAGVVQEWHRAVNWLCRFSGGGWDETSTDT